MLIDTARCIGCGACTIACKTENATPGDVWYAPVIEDEVGEYPDARLTYLPVLCNHCEDAPCIKACPCGALHKGAGGSVQVNYDKCSGHASCKEACPYGAIYIDPVANQAVKCHNCTHRVDVGMEPACVATCPSEALAFGDLADQQRKYGRAVEEMYVHIDTVVGEFMKAMDDYKRKSGRQFPTWSEVLEVIRSLGYRPVAEPVECSGR